MKWRVKMGCWGEQRCEAFTICRIKEKSIINKIRRLSFSSYDESGNLFFRYFIYCVRLFLSYAFFKRWCWNHCQQWPDRESFFFSFIFRVKNVIITVNFAGNRTNFLIFTNNGKSKWLRAYCRWFSNRRNMVEWEGQKKIL